MKWIEIFAFVGILMAELIDFFNLGVFWGSFSTFD